MVLTTGIIAQCIVIAPSLIDINAHSPTQFFTSYLCVTVQSYRVAKPCDPKCWVINCLFELRFRKTQQTTFPILWEVPHSIPLLVSCFTKERVLAKMTVGRGGLLPHAHPLQRTPPLRPLFLFDAVGVPIHSSGRLTGKFPLCKSLSYQSWWRV